MRGTIYLASDHGGWAAKRRLGSALLQRRFVVVDIGPAKHVSGDDYPVWAARAARLVARDPGSRAIVICRTGVGMAVVANKFPGIRAVQGWNRAAAVRSRQDENTNVLSLASDLQSPQQLLAIATAWLKTAYRPVQRFERRLHQIRRIEHAG